MSDNEKSGAPTPAPADLPAPAAPADAPVKAEAAPAENPAAASSPGSPAPAVGTFGSTRGSGLARGKRPTTPAPNATPASGSYKPTSIEVIATASEYKNPFTGETSVNAPRTNEPAPQAAPGPIARETAPATPAPTAPAVAPAPAAAPSAASDEKPELKILPPEQPKRAALRWEASSESTSAPAADQQSQPRRDERPTFRPDRERREGGERPAREGREPRSFDPREPREPRQPRPDERRIEPRSHQPYQPPRPTPPEPEKNSGGFVGWLKGLFGGGKSAESTPSPQVGGEPRREGEQGHRHRHRGGRGRGHQHGGGQGERRGFQGENRGPRPDGPSGGEGGYPQGGEPRGEGDFGGRRRRRRRGGRGRNHGEPRAEGQQGGGAI